MTKIDLRCALAATSLDSMSQGAARNLWRRSKGTYNNTTRASPCRQPHHTTLDTARPFSNTTTNHPRAPSCPTLNGQTTAAPQLPHQTRDPTSTPCSSAPCKTQHNQNSPLKRPRGLRQQSVRISPAARLQRSINAPAQGTAASTQQHHHHSNLRSATHEALHRSKFSPSTSRRKPS